MVKAVECLKYRLGEPDDSGRRRPVPIEDSEFQIELDSVMIAIGNGANPLLTSATPDLKLNKWGYIITDSETGKTSRKNVYAGGDIVTGSATVISAMGAARKTALTLESDLEL